MQIERTRAFEVCRFSTRCRLALRNGKAGSHLLPQILTLMFALLLICYAFDSSKAQQNTPPTLEALTKDEKKLKSTAEEFKNRTTEWKIPKELKDALATFDADISGFDSKVTGPLITAKKNDPEQLQELAQELQGLSDRFKGLRQQVMDAPLVAILARPPANPSPSMLPFVLLSVLILLALGGQVLLALRLEHIVETNADSVKKSIPKLPDISGILEGIKNEKITEDQGMDTLLIMIKNAIDDASKALTQFSALQTQAESANNVLKDALANHKGNLKSEAQIHGESLVKSVEDTSGLLFDMAGKLEKAMLAAITFPESKRPVSQVSPGLTSPAGAPEDLGQLIAIVQKLITLVENLTPTVESLAPTIGELDKKVASLQEQVRELKPTQRLPYSSDTPGQQDQWKASSASTAKPTTFGKQTDRAGMQSESTKITKETWQDTDDWARQLPVVIEKLEEVVNSRGSEDEKKSLNSIKAIYECLFLTWDQWFGEDELPSKWSQTNIAVLDKCLYGSPILPSPQTMREAQPLFNAAKKLLGKMQEDRINELRKRNIQRITGEPGQKIEQGKLEADPEKYEYNSDASLAQTYYGITPGKGGYKYKDETGQWRTLKKTLAILYSPEPPTAS